MTFSAADRFALLPVTLLVLFACALLFAGRRAAFSLLTAALTFTGVALWRQHLWLDANHAAQLAAFDGSIVVDRFSLFFQAIFLVTTGLVAAVSRGIAEDFPEYLAMILLAQSGMFLLAGGTDLMTLFLGLEVMSLSFYVLAGFRRNLRRANEGALKFLILGAFASGLVAYGFSLLFGITGSTRLLEIAAALDSAPRSNVLLALALGSMAAGLLFKVAAAPFHMWAPDAYEGASAPVAAYLAAASTAASIALLVRLLMGPLAGLRGLWEPLLVAAAAATLTIGNLAAMGQNNVKRMLAYSSISHSGYLLFGLIAGNRMGMTGISIYLLTQVFMTVGAFAIVAAVGSNLEDFHGLAKRQPWNAFFMLLFLLSLAGIPPTAGFLGKYYLFTALLETGHYRLALLGTLYVIVSLYYYFRIVRAMWTPPGEIRERGAAGGGMRWALLASAAFTLGIGLYPEPFLRFAQQSVMGTSIAP